MNKSNIKYIIIIVILVFLIGFVIWKFFLNDSNTEIKNNSDITVVKYSVGGGFGTIASTATKTMTFTKDGKLVFSNTYNSDTKDINLGVEKYNELCNYINDRMSLFTEDANENNEILDGLDFSLEITLKDGNTYKVGGYMISNPKFNEIVDKIYELIDMTEWNEYRDNLEVSE